MKILGIDPGTARLGWAIIEYSKGRIGTHICGCITSEKSEEEAKRLLDLYSQINALITLYKPDIASVEEIFFATNAKTVIPVSQARGIVLLACAINHIEVVSYSPLAVKRAITGDGNADKVQMQYMVKELLKRRDIPKPDDAADALAIALTHAYSGTMKQKLL